MLNKFTEKDLRGPFLNFDYINSDKVRWIDIAKFIGEIRIRIIPNYVNQCGMLSISMPDHPELVQKMIEDNERNKIPDELQRELCSKDFELTTTLHLNIPVDLRKDNEFIKAVSSAAHLSKEEIKELKGEN